MDPEINNQQHEEEQHEEEEEEQQEQEDSDYNTASDFDILKEYLESKYGFKNYFSTNAQMNDTGGYDFNFDGSMKVGENEVKHMEMKLVLDEIEGEMG